MVTPGFHVRHPIVLEIAIDGKSAAYSTTYSAPLIASPPECGNERSDPIIPTTPLFPVENKGLTPATRNVVMKDPPARIPIARPETKIP